VLPDFEVFVPNAFTPNGDARNPVFMPVTRGVKNIVFEIFNRWGQRIFITNQLNSGWDGRHQGIDCKEDVYVWKIIATRFDGIEKVFTGDVILIR
jgi:gliding motility-associated-like protein